MVKGFHSGISLSILFFPALILVARPQGFSWTRRRKEEHWSRSLGDAWNAKRNICVSLRDRWQSFFLHLSFHCSAWSYTSCDKHTPVCLVSNAGAGSFLTAFQVCATLPHISSPCLVNASVWSLRWVKWCNCSLMFFPNGCSDTSTGRNPPPKKKIIRTVELMRILPGRPAAGRVAVGSSRRGDPRDPVSPALKSAFLWWVMLNWHYTLQFTYCNASRKYSAQ